MLHLRPRALAALAACALAGCASTAIDDNAAAAHAELRARGAPDFSWLADAPARERARADVEAALARPLTEDDAVRIALAHDPVLQAALFERAAQSADLTQSARPANPVFEFERLAAGGAPGRLEVTRSLTLPLADLLLWPARARAADAAQQSTRLALAADVLRRADDARRAWIAAVADAQSAEYAGRIRDAAQAGAELARRLEATGSFSALQRAREEAWALGAAADAREQLRAARAAREALVRALGLDDALAARLALPASLPEPPAEAPAAPGELQPALAGRLDVRLAQARLEALARAQGWLASGRVVDGLALGGVHKDQTGEPRERGVDLTLPLPVFDPGDAARAGAQARCEAALQRAAAVGVAAASQLRGAQADLQGEWTQAREADTRGVPLQAAITRETLLRYNGMLASPFDLLSQAREQARSVQQAIAARRGYWLADAAWQAALAGAGEEAS